MRKEEEERWDGVKKERDETQREREERERREREEERRWSKVIVCVRVKPTCRSSLKIFQLLLFPHTQTRSNTHTHTLKHTHSSDTGAASPDVCRPLGVGL